LNKRQIHFSQQGIFSENDMINKNRNKMTKLKLRLIFSITMLCIYSVHAQNLNNIDVNKLNDQQIEQIIHEVNLRGLSMNDAIEIAKTRGATTSQIDQLRNRISELGANKGNVDLNNQTPTPSTSNQQAEISQKAKVKTTSKNKEIFGYNLFNTKNLTFEPSVNIPVPKNYVLGIGDQLTINIWGASQHTYQLPVNSNGSISIPDLGPIYVSGLDFNEAEKRIHKRLTAIYQGMQGKKPNTFAEISITNPRSIKINVIGDVNAPGTYTLPATASAFNALYLSGGPNGNGSFRNIQVLRDNNTIGQIDVYDFLIHRNTAQNISLRDQDIIFIPTYQKRVAVSGAFKREGYYELKKNETLSDLLRFSGGFSDNAYKNRLSVIRMTGKDFKVLDVPDSLFHSFIPQNGDSIIAGQIIHRFENRVNINGAVFRPGTYQLTDSMRLSDLIKKADGVREDVFSNRGLLIRLGKDLSPMQIAFNVNDVLQGKNDILLHREDQVVVQDISNMQEYRFVKVYGQVRFPGKYQYRDDMSLKDLIFMAGGLTEAASESFIEVARRRSYQQAAKVSDQLVSLYQMNIDRDLSLSDKDASFTLHPFDYVYIRKAPSYNEQRTVSVSGEVVYPGEYSISSKDERISDLLKRAGGLTPQAYTNGATMLRKNADGFSMNRSINDIMPDSLVSKAEKQLKISKLELQLNKILASPGGIYDYILRAGDQIDIPEELQEVNVSGEVLNPMGLAYQGNKSLKYYIDRSGGFSSKAKKGKVFIIYSDGTTKVTKKFFGRSYPKPAPGCQIIVPSKPERKGGDQTTKWLAIASTFSSIAIAVAALLK